MNTCLITYHAAHNFGSMLQAYATQEVVESLGHHCDVINYRMKEQKEFYSLLRTQYGLASFMKDIILIPFYKSRKISSDRYERFIQEYLHLTDEVATPYEVSKLWEKYDIAISGSDQIWNKHSFEMEHNDWEYLNPYLLAGFNGRKVSYASSIGGMNNDELCIIKEKIDSYDYISTREEMAAARIEDMLRKPVVSVLDPTFLLSKDEWINKLNLRQTNEKPYILYYSLRGYKNGIPRMKALKQIANERNMSVKVLTPFYYLPYFDAHFVQVFEYGPIEFLQAIYNASMIISESYHGTILSINFEKDVYSLCGNKGAEYRKIEILKKLGLEDRIIYNVGQLLAEHKPINYTEVSNKLTDLQRKSREYLNASLER